MKFYQEFTGVAIDNGREVLRFPAAVPGNIQNDYAAASGIGDFNYSNNCEKFRVTEGYTWNYEADIKFSRNEDERVYFVSHGIDYYSSVTVNGQEVDRHEGMFSDIEVDITDYLKEDGNKLVVTVYPHPKRESAVKGTRDEADTSVKPPVCYGWDWHPRLLISGMWQEAYIETRKAEYITDWSYDYTMSEDRTSAVVNFTFEGTDNAKVELFDAENKLVYSGNGKNFTLDNVNLWWCNGHGPQYLYKYVITGPCNSIEGKLGFRTISLEMADGEWGKPRNYPMSRSNPPVVVCLNGKKIFAKGSNFVTPELFSGTMTRERYEEMVKMVNEANMNIVRMWGGCGIQKNMFYELCDEYGIMVWQEFPLACNRYGFHDDTKHYAQILKQEAVSIIKRILKHPCLTLWCGGNELFNNWSLMTEQSEPLRLLDKLTFEMCSHIPFLMTSPLSGMAHGPYSFYIEGVGDCFKAFQTSEHTAYTEFGCRSVSSPEYIKEFMSEEDMKNMKGEDGNPWRLHHGLDGRVDRLYPELDRYSLPSDTLEDAYENSCWLQNEGIRSIFEEARRQWPTCSMAINWFFNEPWKIVKGNSLVLYPAVKKPVYDYVKDALRPFHACARIPKFDWKDAERFTAELWYLNDMGEDFEDTVTATLIIGDEEHELATWKTGVNNHNVIGPTVNFVLPPSSEEYIVLRLTTEKGLGAEYKLRFYPTIKKERPKLREMNSTNDL